MANSNNKQSAGLLSSAFGVAKKLSASGVSMLNHVAPDTVTQVTQPFSSDKTIEGSAQQKGIFDTRKYDNPQQILREHVPNVSRQLLGRHYGTINNVANFVAPQFSDKVSDYFFDQINQFTSNISSVDSVLDEAGVRDLEELTQDVSRSKRIGQALAEQNKWIASVQGAVSGATGVIGSAIDIPASLILALRTIYQVGRSYGFDLSKETDQEIVQFIFKQIDLGLITEKQTLLLGLKALSSTVKNHDVSQLQQLLGSSNDVEGLKKWLLDDKGEMKWAWLNQIPKVSLLDHLTKLTPLASAGVSAVYSWRLVDDVNQKAQEVFAHAREYLIQHKESTLSAYAAYEKATALLAQATPKLLESLNVTTPSLSEPMLDQDVEVEGNDNIVNVKLVRKQDKVEGDVAPSETIAQGLGELADKMVEPHAQVELQKPALSVELELDQQLESDDVIPTTEQSENTGEVEADVAIQTESKAAAQNITKSVKAKQDN